MKTKNLFCCWNNQCHHGGEPCLGTFSDDIHTGSCHGQGGAPGYEACVYPTPFEAGHTMDMGSPENFVVLHKEQKTDLTGNLKPITWKSLTNSGQAYEVSHKLRGMGDWVFWPDTITLPGGI